MYQFYREFDRANDASLFFLCHKKFLKISQDRGFEWQKNRVNSEKIYKKLAIVMIY